MNKSILNKWLFGAMALFAAASFTACSDDDDPTGDPSIEAEVSSLAFTVKGGEATFDLKANLPWSVALPEDCDWIAVDPMEGRGDARVTVTVAENDFSREGSFEFVTADPALKQTIRVRQGEMLPEVTLYAETFGTAAVAEPYPSVSRYTGWATSGTGAATVSYGGTNVRIGTAAEGVNAALFGAKPAVLRVQKIALTPPQRRMRLTFKGNYAGTVAVGDDGERWSALNYTMTDGAASIDFVLAEEAEELYLRFATDAGSGTIEEIALTTINGDGTRIDLTQGTVIEEPTLAPLKVKELVAMALAGEPVDERSVEGFVAAIGGSTENFAASNVILCDNDGAAQSAMVFYSSALLELGLEVGDKLSIALANAEYAPYNGLREYKGIAKDDVKVLSKGATIAYTTITAAQLVNEFDKYMSMPVQIEKARPAAASVGKNFATGLTFVADGTEFAVYNRKDWTVGKGVKVADTEATIRGICSVFNTPQLIPTTAEDIAAFADESGDEPGGDASILWHDDFSQFDSVTADGSQDIGKTLTGSLAGFTDAYSGGSVKVYQAAGKIKLGSSSAKGILETPALKKVTTAAADAVLTVDLTAWKSTGAADKTKVIITVNNGGTIEGEASITTEQLDEAGKTYTFNLAGITAATTITFEAAVKSKHRYYLDNLKISLK